MVRDEKTRHNTPAGEIPKLAKYIMMVQVSLVPTTIESHRHTLSAVSYVMWLYYMSSKTDCYMCYQRGVAL